MVVVLVEQRAKQVGKTPEELVWFVLSSIARRLGGMVWRGERQLALSSSASLATTRMRGSF